MDEHTSSRSRLVWMIFTRIGLIIPLICAFFFLPAGTLDYWEAWVYLVVLLLPMGFVIRYLYIHSPDLLARRMQFRERTRAQQRLQPVANLVILIAFILPGFDRRWEWSQVPAWLVAAADAAVLLGYGLVFLSFRENRYAARVVQVEAAQQVIRSGPYAVVRHPMYAGVILMFTLSSLALGSYWALIPGVLVIPVIVLRILTEEATLHRELKGYTEYTHQVRCRLLPGVW